jgi:hypothetical protein
MKNPIEDGPERIPTKESVMEVISRFTKNAVLVQELFNEQDLSLLEMEVKGKEDGETVRYEYARPVKSSDNREIAIYRTIYRGEVPMGGDKISVFYSETGEWEDVE